MNNENIISNKFGLNLETVFSYNRIEFSPHLSLSKRYFWYANVCLHFSKRAVPLQPSLNHATLTGWGKLNTTNLLTLTRLDKLLSILQTFLLFSKTKYLNEEVNRTEPSPSVCVPWLKLSNLHIRWWHSFRSEESSCQSCRCRLKITKEIYTLNIIFKGSFIRCISQCVFVVRFCRAFCN
jgi:hypothetical protein